jgi:hypothetical protein
MRINGKEDLHIILKVLSNKIKKKIAIAVSLSLEKFLKIHRRP